MDPIKPRPSGKIRKGLLTPCRTLGLSRKWKIETFKSPLLQENVALSPDSASKESPVLRNLQSNSTTVENKRRGDNFNGNIAKKSKKCNESNIKNVKKKLIKEELNENVESSEYLNVSGCNLLELDESNKNENVEKKETTCKLSVCLKRLPEGKLVKESEMLQEVKIKKSSKDKSLIVEKILTPVKSKVISSQKSLSNELENKPLLNSLKASSEKKSKPNSNKKNSIDEYVKNKMKKKSSKSGSKLSLKKTMTQSFESDDDFLKKPNSNGSLNKSDSLSDSVNKSDLIKKIIILRKTVSDKESLLERYKQADIYRKLHNVDKLMELKSIWIQGCQNALQDLLIKLHENDSNMQMTKLLIRLRAPPELLKYNEKTCDFE